MDLETRSEQAFKQLELFRFPIERGHRCRNWFWQFANSVKVVKENCRIVIVCKLMECKQSLVCLNRRRGVFVAKLGLTCRAVLLLLSWRCTRGAASDFFVSSCHYVLAIANVFCNSCHHVAAICTLSLSELPSPCRGNLLGQRWEGRLQDEGHSGSHPHSFPSLY